MPLVTWQIVHVEPLQASFVQFDISIPSDQRCTAIQGQDNAYAHLKQQWINEREAARQVLVQHTYE